MATLREWAGEILFWAFMLSGLGVAWLTYRVMRRRNCHYCDGRGQIAVGTPRGFEWHDCPKCNGRA